jgi:hypothetical protein
MQLDPTMGRLTLEGWTDTLYRNVNVLTIYAACHPRRAKIHLFMIITASTLFPSKSIFIGHNFEAIKIYVSQICGSVCHEHKSNSFICCCFDVIHKSDLAQINNYVMQLWKI